MSTTHQAAPPRTTPALWAGLTSAVGFLGVLPLTAALADGAVPRPGEDPAATLAYFTANATAIEVGALVRTVAAVLLVVFAAGVAARVRRTGTVAGVLPEVVLAGGVLAAATATLSAFLGMALAALPAGTDAGPVTALRLLNFLTGGAGHTVWLGLLVGGVGLACRRAALLPRWLTTSAMVSGTLGLLSALSLVVFGASLFIPLGRFSGLLLVAVIGTMLALGRGTRDVAT